MNQILQNRQRRKEARQAQGCFGNIGNHSPKWSDTS